MAGWSGRRKALTILLFVAPTLIGVFLFSVYPFIFNGYISLTNRNQFHPNPDCTNTLTRLFEPTCWTGKAPQGMSTPFKLEEPLLSNYTDLFGDMFTGDGIGALARLLACFLPLVIAAQVNRRLDHTKARSQSPGTIRLFGWAGVVALIVLLDAPGAINLLTRSGDFIVVTLRTVLYVVICVPLFFLVALILALLLNTPNLKGRAIFRTIMIVPWAASTVAVMMSLVWQFFFRERGTINQVLAAIGLQGPSWLNDPVWAFVAVVIANIWYSYPFLMITILGALQAIPADQYEAADLDGATWWNKLTQITLPLIRPAILPALVLTSITTFQMFGTVWAITRGGPTGGAGVSGATEMVMIYGYKQAFQLQEYGRTGAYAIIIFVVLFIATLYSLRVTRITQGAYE